MKLLETLTQIIRKCKTQERNNYIVVFIPEEYENLSHSLEFYMACYQELVGSDNPHDIICVPLRKWRDTLDYGTISHIEVNDGSNR